MAVQNTPGEGDVNVVQFRIERGAEAMATDGRIGIVQQIVVDRTSGQLLSLVIRGEETDTEFEMLASHVQRATGDHVYLDVSRTGLMDNPGITTPYDPEQYVPVYQGDAMPLGFASRVAAEQEKPIITDVEENAAELVAPEMTAALPEAGPTRRTDERVAGPAAASTIWIPEEGAALETDTSPTLKLNRMGDMEAAQAPTDWGEAVGAEELPPVEEGMANPSSAPQAMPVTQAAVTPAAITGIPLEQPVPGELPPAPAPQPMTAPSQQFANLRDHLPDLLLNMARSPEFWILSGSLGVGIVGGILMRRRAVSPDPASTIGQAKDAAGNVPSRAQDRPQEAQSRIADTTGETLEGSKRTISQTRQQVKKSARRTARRARWFRRGLLLGGAGGILFAPQRGEETRMQLKTTLEQLRSRFA